MSDPKVSVIIPSYNHAAFIEEAVRSVLDQTFRDLELVVIDDGSSDDSVEILERLAAQDPRIIILTRENRGTAATLNQGLEMARGKWIAILNSDDRYHPNRIERLIDVVEEDPSCLFVFTGVRLIDARGDELTLGPDREWLDSALNHYRDSGKLLLSLVRANFALTTSNFFFSRDKGLEIGGFRDLRYVNDLDFLFRITDGHSCWIEDVLLEYRKHGGNVISEMNHEGRPAFMVEMAWVLARHIDAAVSGSAALIGDFIRALEFYHSSAIGPMMMFLYLSEKGVDLEEALSDREVREYALTLAREWAGKEIRNLEERTWWSCELKRLEMDLEETRNRLADHKRKAEEKLAKQEREKALLRNDLDRVQWEVTQTREELKSVKGWLDDIHRSRKFRLMMAASGLLHGKDITRNFKEMAKALWGKPAAIEQTVEKTAKKKTALDQVFEVRSVPGKVEGRICVVTPDIIGPMKNGGIGTHCFFLAEFLTRIGCEVTVLYTIHGGKSLHRWKKRYADRGIRFEALEEYGSFECEVHGCEGYSQKSMLVHRWLRNRSFDVIHFQDWQANGFIPVQAKRSGLAYDETLLTVTMHSPEQWHRQGTEQWPWDPLGAVMRTWCERYTCRHADVVISPTAYMLDWAQSNSWSLSEKKMVLPLLYQRPVPQKESNAEVDPGHITFFGRLETRKGAVLFCDALRETLKVDPAAVRKVTFLGKSGEIYRRPGDEYVRERLRDIPGLQVEFISGLDSFQAMDHLRGSASVVVIPSLLDNSPYTVIECIENGIPFLAAATGGIPELADPRVLFQPTVDGLAEALLGLKAIVAESPKHPYSSDKSEKQWLDFHGRPALQESTRPAQSASVKHPPQVSVIVPYYNHGRFLPECLHHLSRSTYPNFEVVVLNDGSTDPFSIETFERMSKSFPEWTFITQENGGLGNARNSAAKHARGSLLIFHDSDNVANPDMIWAMVMGMERSGADCLTCHFNAFTDKPESTPVNIYAPLGQCLEYGGLANIFGDANFIIQKALFDRLGGFTEDRLGYEDWEFLVKLGLAGYDQDVIPEPLFWYRESQDSMLRTCNDYHSRSRVIRAYREHAPWLGFQVGELLIPLYERFRSGQIPVAAHDDDSFRGQALGGLMQTIDRLFPPGTRRRKWMKGIARRMIR